MKDLEKIILEELSTLDDMRLIDVIGFIRYLKADKPLKQEWITDWYESALQTMRDQNDEMSIPDEQARKNPG